jgi:hypothetical protein
MRLLAPVLLSSLLAAWPAAAVTISASAAGTITSVDPALSAEFSVGEAVAFSYSFDSLAADFSSDPQTGAYGAAGFATTWGDYSATAANGTILIENDLPGDGYGAGSNVVVGDAVGIFALDRIQLELDDSSASVFSDDSLPLSVDLADFDERRMVLRFSYAGTTAFVTASLDALTVPEPGSAGLFGAALAALAWFRRSR